MRLGRLSGAPGIQARACPSSPVPIWGQVGVWAVNRNKKERNAGGSAPEEQVWGNGSNQEAELLARAL